MNGEHKTIAVIVTMVAGCVVWATWNFTQYHERRLAAEVRPSSEAVISCVDTCARVCMAEAP